MMVEFFFVQPLFALHRAHLTTATDSRVWRMQRDVHFSLPVATSTQLVLTHASHQPTERTLHMRTGVGGGIAEL